MHLTVKFSKYSHPILHYRYTTKCTTVSPNSESEGELLIGEDSVFFVADEAVTDANYTQVCYHNPISLENKIFD